MYFSLLSRYVKPAPLSRLEVRPEPSLDRELKGQGTSGEGLQMSQLGSAQFTVTLVSFSGCFFPVCVVLDPSHRSADPGPSCFH